MPGISSLINQIAREMKEKGTECGHSVHSKHTCKYCGTLLVNVECNCPNCGAPPKEK